MRPMCTYYNKITNHNKREFIVIESLPKLQNVLPVHYVHYVAKQIRIINECLWQAMNGGIINKIHQMAVIVLSVSATEKIKEEPAWTSRDSDKQKQYIKKRILQQ